jgi:hypothetical protein
MPAARFALVTGILAAGWVGLVFLILRQFGGAAESVLNSSHGIPVAAAALALVLTRNRWRSLPRKLLESPAIQRWMQWEFWPAWLFYLPIALNYLRFRSRTAA